MTFRYAFAKISLQSWGSKSLKCWGELIDVAYSSIRCQALYSTWENEAFLFRVIEKKNRETHKNAVIFSLIHVVIDL